MARQTPLRQVIVEGILARIKSGQLAPGDWFTATQVREWFDAGREPANTALRSLVDRGVLDVHPGKGYRVPPART